MTLEPIEFHYALDRRCYYGAPCSDLQREWDSIDKAKKQLKENNFDVVYFPNGSYYIGFRRYDNRAPDILTNECKTFESCYNKIMEIVMGLYINPVDMSKDEWLAKNGTVTNKEDIDYEQCRMGNCYPVCLVDNGPFTAAGVAFDINEFNSFSNDNSGRPMVWYIVAQDDLFTVVSKDSPYFKHYQA